LRTEADSDGIKGEAFLRIIEIAVTVLPTVISIVFSYQYGIWVLAIGAIVSLMLLSAILYWLLQNKKKEVGILKADKKKLENENVPLKEENRQLLEQCEKLEELQLKIEPTIDAYFFPGETVTTRSEAAA
jgi:cell division protein FtsB